MMPAAVHAAMLKMLNSMAATMEPLHWVLTATVMGTTYKGALCRARYAHTVKAPGHTTSTYMYVDAIKSHGYSMCF